MASTPKVPGLINVIARLRRDLGPGYLVEVPHWDEDAIGVGFGRPDDPRILIYIAYYDSGLYYECELPTEGSYEVVARGADVAYDVVLEAARRHLAP